MSATVKGLPLNLVTAWVTPLVSKRIGSVFVVPVGMA